MKTLLEPTRTDQAADAGFGLTALVRSVSKLVLVWSLPLLNRKWMKALFLIVIGAACLARAYIGLRGSDIFTHDAFMLFDGAWRMLNGQRPHIDFYTHVGVLTYAPTVLGLWIAHGTANGLGYGQSIVGIFVGAWAYLLGRKRLSDTALILMCLCIVLMASAPFSLGFSPLSISPGMTYNRFGYVLIALLLMEALLEHKQGARNAEFWGGVSTGAIVAIVLFLKITYFMASIFLVVALLPCRAQTLRRWFGLMAGFVAGCIPFLLYFRFQLRPMLADLIGVAGGKHVKIRWYFLDAILQDAAFLFVLAVMAALLLLGHDRAKPARAILTAALAVCVAGVLLIFGNYEQSGFPLAVFFAIIVTETVNRRLPHDPGNPNLFHVSVVLLGSTFVAASLTSNALGFSYGLLQRVWQGRDVPSINSPVLSGFAPAKEEQYYTMLYNDGLDLVRKYRRAGDTVMSLDFCNPFSYGLSMKPARGGTPVLQYKTTFNDRHKPSPEWLFGFARLVMVPKVFDPDLDDVLRLYGPYLDGHFRMIGESAFWRLYRNVDEP